MKGVESQSRGSALATRRSLWHFAPREEAYDLKQLELPEHLHSLDEMTHVLPPGVYTTFIVYPGMRVLRFAEHMRRLQESARLVGVALEVPLMPLRKALRHLLSGEQSDCRWRVRVVLVPDETEGPVSYLILEALPPVDEAVYQHGVQVVCAPFQRELPRAKLTLFIQQSDLLRKSLSGEIEEVLLVDPAGYLLEGLSSNFFAFKGEALYTAAEGVLEGITRQIALEAARQLSIPIQLHPVRLEELGEITEAFLTSSSRGVMPVVRIDDVQVGHGLVGEKTQMLRRAYLAQVQTELEEL